MNSNAAISTGWNSKRNKGSRELVEEIRSLGINSLEAGYGLNPGQIEELLELLPGKIFKINSVHNFCPTPPKHKCSWGDDQLLSSLDEDERREGIKQTLQTFKLAEKFGARIVVLHLGRVPIEPDLYLSIKEYVKNDMDGSDGFKKAVGGLKRLREKRAGPYFEAARRTLEDLMPLLPKGMKLGIENRYEYQSIPVLQEMQQLLAEYGPAAGYWHDTGHAYVTEFLGYYEKDELIRNLGSKLIGMHIHDCRKMSDHLAPGLGNINFEVYKPYLHDDVLRVLELHSTETYDDVAKVSSIYAN